MPEDSRTTLFFYWPNSNPKGRNYVLMIRPHSKTGGGESFGMRPVRCRRDYSPFSLKKSYELSDASSPPVLSVVHGGGDGAERLF